MLYLPTAGTVALAGLVDPMVESTVLPLMAAVPPRIKSLLSLLLLLLPPLRHL
jgi:hypothetical protein